MFHGPLSRYACTSLTVISRFDRMKQHTVFLQKSRKSALRCSVAVAKMAKVLNTLVDNFDESMQEPFCLCHHAIVVNCTARMRARICMLYLTGRR